MTYEQRTPTESQSTTVKNAIHHAQDKRADVALIYDKFGNFHRNTIEEGIRLHEAKSNYRCKYIMVISQNKNVYIHYHND